MNKNLFVSGLIAVMTVTILSKANAFSVNQEAASEEEELPAVADEEAGEANRTLFDGAKIGCSTSCGGCSRVSPIPIPPPITTLNLPSITYSTNCDFCDHELYTLTCIPTAFACATLCANDRKCTHFTYITNLNGGTCRLKSAPGAGGAWATMISSPSPYVCGYILKRAFNSILLNICVGLDISISGLINL